MMYSAPVALVVFCSVIIIMFVGMKHLKGEDPAIDENKDIITPTTKYYDYSGEECSQIPHFELGEPEEKKQDYIRL